MVLRGIELQVRTRTRLRKTERGQAIVLSFKLGPLLFCVVANLPENDEGELDEHPLAYVKLTLQPDADWELYKEHS